ncbi:MAG: Fungal specific transcription factor [Bathelium mastoideum]|nr:MAG: Fungal specific transcription factor [Bathelium mastoideum]
MTGAKERGQQQQGTPARGKRSHQHVDDHDEEAPFAKARVDSSNAVDSPEAVRSSTFRNGKSRRAIDAGSARIVAILPSPLAGHALKLALDVWALTGKERFLEEQRITLLEELLEDNDIHVPSADDVTLRDHVKRVETNPSTGDVATVQKETPSDLEETKGQSTDEDDMTQLVERVRMVPTQGTSDPHYLGSTSGISFARVVFAAIRSSVLGSSAPSQPPKHVNGHAKSSMRDSFFGLHSKPTIGKAAFPDKELAMKLVDLYFNYANAQLPILHRDQFWTRMEQVYSEDESMRSSRDLYMLNIVFAIGAGVLLGDPSSYGSLSSGSNSELGSPPSSKKRKLPSQQAKPEEYHASAIVHLESFLGSNITSESRDGFGSGLEELQAVLLLASFALLRPIAPGLWYIVGVAVRLAIDLGLHHEEGVGIDESSAADHPADTVEEADSRGSIYEQRHRYSLSLQSSSSKPDAQEVGRRQWSRDLRRRLFWCTYSFDRIVSVCTGRPFGISDQVITTEFCSVLDDAYITPFGFTPCQSNQPSYKFVAHHYFRLRLLQSEILGVLHYRQARRARAHGLVTANAYMIDTPSPYLHRFDSFTAWRRDVDERLFEWRESAPQKGVTGVKFNSLFLELNYWQAIIVLYRQNFSGPSERAGGSISLENANYSSAYATQDEEEDGDLIYRKTAEAGRKVVKLYRQLHRLRLVNYTTHHLFMAGIAFLFAIWHSQVVRSGLTLEDIDSTVLAARSVLEDLAEHCPPAQACREAFDRMSKATLKLCLSTGKDAEPQVRPSPAVTDARATQRHKKSRSTNRQKSKPNFTEPPNEWGKTKKISRVPIPQFDMNLQNLLAGEAVGPPQMDSNNAPTSAGSTDYPVSGPYDPNTTLSEAPQYPYEVKTETEPFPQSQTWDQPYGDPGEAAAVPVADATDLSEISELGTTGSGQLDFLDAFPMESGNEWDLAGTENLDLGFGMQLGFGGGRHDWNEAVSSDLLDGLFFGGTGGNMNGL